MASTAAERSRAGCDPRGRVRPAPGAGVRGLAIEAVAKGAGAGETTIYRWWASRQGLAAEAFFHSTRAELAFPDTGSAREDFRQQIQQLGDLLRGPAGDTMAGMIAASRHDELLRTALSERWIEPRRKWGQDRMARTVGDGECVPGLRTDVGLELLDSPIYARLLFGRGIPSANDIDDLFRTAAARSAANTRPGVAGPRAVAGTRVLIAGTA